MSSDDITFRRMLKLIIGIVCIDVLLFILLIFHILDSNFGATLTSVTIPLYILGRVFIWYLDERESKIQQVCKKLDR